MLVSKYAYCSQYMGPRALSLEKYRVGVSLVAKSMLHVIYVIDLTWLTAFIFHLLVEYME